jgi:calcium-dependent protein kinase
MELNIMNKLDHINILKVIDFYEDKDHYYIVMDLCMGGDLFDYLIKRGNLDENVAATLMQ